jgi:hypothetical protein
LAARASCWAIGTGYWQTSPAAQTPLAHTAGSASVQICPGFRRHAPIASQVFVDALQESVSSALFTGEHVPGTVPLQVTHELPLPHAMLQQTPSAQKPLWQLLACPPGQLCPVVPLRQLPAPSHTVLPGQILGLVVSG